MVGLAAEEAAEEAGRCLRCDIKDSPLMTENPIHACTKLSIRIDGEYVAAQRRPDHSGSRARQREVHPHALLAGRPDRRGRLPPLHRGGLGRGPPAARLHHAGAGRHERHHQLREARALSPHGARIPVLGAQSPVRRVRLQQPLRTAGHGAAAGRHQRALSLRLSAAAGGRLARALRAGSQPLHPVHPLRAGLRRSGRRARVGHERRAASAPWWCAI